MNQKVSGRIKHLWNLTKTVLGVTKVLYKTLHLQNQLYLQILAADACSHAHKHYWGLQVIFGYEACLGVIVPVPPDVLDMFAVTPQYRLVKRWTPVWEKAFLLPFLAWRMRALSCGNRREIFFPSSWFGSWKYSTTSRCACVATMSPKSLFVICNSAYSHEYTHYFG